ncbi:MAG: pyridoxamine 5'-phosphate oxidase family protein [Candidatus Binataceae bacterium]
MSRRREIQLTPEEKTEFLNGPHKAALATVDKDGFPHVVAMNYMARGDVIYMTSYGKAQKVVNARRNPKVGVMVESGKRYAELRGVMIRGYCEVIEDPETVANVMREIAGKEAGQAQVPRGPMTSAPKRVVLKVTPHKVSTWDHGKLGGRY